MSCLKPLLDLYWYKVIFPYYSIIIIIKPVWTSSQSFSWRKPARFLCILNACGRDTRTTFASLFASSSRILKTITKSHCEWRAPQGCGVCLNRSFVFNAWWVMTDVYPSSTYDFNTSIYGYNRHVIFTVTALKKNKKKKHRVYVHYPFRNF